jgi:hypothetical protein
MSLWQWFWDWSDVFLSVMCGRLLHEMFSHQPNSILGKTLCLWIFHYKSCGRWSHAALYTVSFSISSSTTSDLCDVALQTTTLRRSTQWRLTLRVPSEGSTPHDPARSGGYPLHSVRVLINCPVGGWGEKEGIYYVRWYFNAHDSLRSTPQYYFVN